MEREIVIVGAGPSGATAAIALTQLGHDVLLMDRQAFPRDKTCGDGIPAGAIEILYSLGMEEKIRDANFYPAHRLLLSSPRGYVLEAELHKGPQFQADSYIIPRMEFDALIQAHAVESGVDFVKGQVKEPIIENGQVVGVRARLNGKTEDIRAKIVIGADGVTSVISRALRPDDHIDKHRAIALRTYITDIDELPNEVEFYLYKSILPGYAWIFPLGEGKANLGLGMRLDKYRAANESLESMVEIFLDMPEIKKRLKNGGKLSNTAKWQLNFGSQPFQRAYDGAILVGDAAGLINPLTGGGIHNGLQSALIAADVVHEALLADNTSLSQLQSYDIRLEDTMRSGMRKSYNIQRSLLRFPLIVDGLIRVGGSNGDVAQIFVDKL